MCNDRNVPVAALRSPDVRSVRVLFWPLAVALGLVSAIIARNNASGGFGGKSTLNGILELCTGWSLLAAGFVLLRGPVKRTGVLFVGAGCAWFVVEWNNPGSDSAVVFTIGLVGSALTPALVAHGVLAYPGGKLRSTFEQVAVGAAYVATGIGLGLGPAIVFEPALAGCAQCPSNLLVVHSSVSLYDDLNALGLYLGIAVVALISGLFVWRLTRPSLVSARREAVILFAGLAFLAFVVWDYGHSLARGSLGTDAFDARLWRAEAVALCALAAGVGWGWLRQRRSRAAVARLVLELGRTPRPGAVRDAIAAELGDPELELAYRRPHDGHYVDASGEPVSIESRPGRALTPIVSNGRPLAVLGHSETLLKDPALVNEVVATAHLAIENEQLEAEVQGTARRSTSFASQNRGGRRYGATQTRARSPRRGAAAPGRVALRPPNRALRATRGRGLRRCRSAERGQPRARARARRAA